MKKLLIALVLGTLLAIPSILRAEEVEIRLSVVLEMESIGGLEPMDNPKQSDGEPPRPTDFRASINGNSLVIEKQDEAIPSAQATVVNASTGNVVLNQPFTDSLQEQVASAVNVAGKIFFQYNLTELIPPLIYAYIVYTTK
mgnify:CR=1 FL=1